MPIASTDIKIYLSGGTSNTDPNAALGGGISTTLLVDNTLHNLFDKVTGAEATSGDVEYRAIFIKNTHATLTYEGSSIYIDANTTSADTEVQIAIADEAIGSSTIETIANENTAPVGPVFSTANGVANSILIGDIAPGQMKGIWIKWSTVAGALAVLDTVTIKTFGDTNP